MNRLGIPQERIAKRLGIPQTTLSDHLPKLARLPNSVNSDLSRGFTVSQVAEKHGWTEPMVWSEALKGKDDLIIYDPPYFDKKAKEYIRTFKAGIPEIL